MRRASELLDSEFPRLIRKARYRVGLTQEELAAETHQMVTAKTISRWERGVNMPLPGPKLRSILEPLGVTMDYFRRGDDSNGSE